MVGWRRAITEAAWTTSYQRTPVGTIARSCGLVGLGTAIDARRRFAPAANGKWPGIEEGTTSAREASRLATVCRGGARGE